MTEQLTIGDLSAVRGDGNSRRVTASKQSNPVYNCQRVVEIKITLAIYHGGAVAFGPDTSRASYRPLPLILSSVCNGDHPEALVPQRKNQKDFTH